MAHTTSLFRPFLLAAMLASLPAAATATASPPGAAAPAGAPAPARAVPGDELAFDDMVHYLGATVRVTTRVQTVREGVVTGASSIVFNLEVAAGQGRFSLAMPREHVVRIELVADAPAAD